MTLDNGSMLRDRLAEVLPIGGRFTIHHLSTPPTQSRPLYAAPPGALAEETYCESHFLSVSIQVDGNQLQVFGIEVLIYSTEFLTTLFVSKADSTGYLYLLGLSCGTPSPLRCISTTFLRYLIEERRRTDRRLVLSLFARAQNQYLFPGSIENSHKHVLDDRGLIKWWCKVVDPILGSSQNEGPSDKNLRNIKNAARGQDETISRGFLRVPGCDTYETRTFLTKEERARNPEKKLWYTSDPLNELGRSPNLPERCLIPRFPDDPKARFVEQLDDELPEENSAAFQTQSQNSESLAKKPDTGRWRSVKSLEQFWDTMSFRQECSSGRLVGFLWATFQPAGLLYSKNIQSDRERSRSPTQTILPTPEVSQQREIPPLPPQSPMRSSPVPETPSTPSKVAPSFSQRTPEPTPQKTKEAAIQSQPEETGLYYWPKSSRGEVVLRQKDYQRVNNLLLRLDYAHRVIASDSTRRWINDVCIRAGVKQWGQSVVGTLAVATKTRAAQDDCTSTMLNVGLIRKKKRPAEQITGQAESREVEEQESGVNVLTTELVRKKAKVVVSAALLPEEVSHQKSSAVPG